MVTPTDTQRDAIRDFLLKNEEVMRREIIFLTEDVIDPPKPAVNQSLAIHAPEALEEGPAVRLANFLLELSKGLKGEEMDTPALRDGLSIVGGLINEARQEVGVLEKMTSGGALEAKFRQRLELRKDEPLKPDQRTQLERVLAKRNKELTAVREDMPVLETLQGDIIDLLKVLEVRTSVRQIGGENRGVA